MPSGRYGANASRMAGIESREGSPPGSRILLVKISSALSFSIFSRWEANAPYRDASERMLGIMAVFLLSFLEVFGQVDDLLAEGVKLPRGFVEVIELTGQTTFGKVGIDGLNDLVVVVSDADKLVVKTA